VVDKPAQAEEHDENDLIAAPHTPPATTQHTARTQPLAASTMNPEGQQ
jgi:hypothetical protein